MYTLFFITQYHMLTYENLYVGIQKGALRGQLIPNGTVSDESID